MNHNLQALTSVCRRRGVDFAVLHPTGNVVQIDTPRGPALFANWTTPLNTHAAARLCEDKEFAYQAMHRLVPMPRTEAFLNPRVDPKYREYVTETTTDAIAAAVERTFGLPAVIKRNRGSHGSNVFLVTEPEMLRARVERVFDEGSKHYDYVCLAQEYIHIEAEYRAVFLDGEIVFAYQKLAPPPRSPEENLSPFHRESARACLAEDRRLLQTLGALVAPALKQCGIGFAGVDIALDEDGSYSVIELNASPGFDQLVEDCGSAAIERLYELVLARLLGDTTRMAKASHPATG